MLNQADLHTWGESHLITVHSSHTHCCIRPANALIRIFTSMFTTDIGLQFSCPAMSLPELGVRVVLAVLGGVSSYSLCFYSLKRAVGS